jgi:hypothetical protein
MSATHPWAVRLGRRFAPDERDAGYRMFAAMAQVPTPSYRYWALGKIDASVFQYNTPRCVGFSTRMELASSPRRYKQAHPDGGEIYHGAQLNDEWEGENYDGTSARGAMKYLQSLGIIAAYHWASDVEELAQFVLTTGPALIGGVWTNDAFTPDSKGFVRQTGAVAGGHEVLLRGYNHKEWRFTLWTPWENWGVKRDGEFYMNRTDFENWMSNAGDMVAPIEA